MWPKPPVTSTTGRSGNPCGASTARMATAQRLRQNAVRRAGPPLAPGAPSPARPAVGQPRRGRHPRRRGRCAGRDVPAAGPWRARCQRPGSVDESPAARGLCRAPPAASAAGRTVGWLLSACASRIGAEQRHHGGRVEVGAARRRGAPAVDDAGQPAVARRTPGRRAAGTHRVRPGRAHMRAHRRARKRSPCRTTTGWPPAPRRRSATAAPRPVCSSKTKIRRPLRASRPLVAAPPRARPADENQSEVSRGLWAAAAVRAGLRADPVAPALERIRRQADARPRVPCVKPFPIDRRPRWPTSCPSPVRMISVSVTASSGLRQRGQAERRPARALAGLGGEGRQRPPRAHLKENRVFADRAVRRRQGAQTVGEAHRRTQLRAPVGRAASRGRRPIRRSAWPRRDGRRGQRHARDQLLELPQDRIHHRRVEGVRGVQPPRGHRLHG